MTIIYAILGSSVLTVILNRVFNCIDKKKDKQDEILEKISEVQTELNNHKDEYAKHKAEQSRTRILRFSDELTRGIKHSEEMFNNILLDIDNYTQYCKENEGVYVNSKAEAAIENIKRVYESCVSGALAFL